MSRKAFDKIAEGLREAAAIARGEASPAKLHAPTGIDVPAIRGGDLSAWRSRTPPPPKK